jgi:putative chitinase
MIDIRKLQTALGVTPDGVAGVGTFTALFRKWGASADRAPDLAVCAARWFADYGLMDSPLRLAHFLAQLIHESGSFRYMEEIASGQAYEGRRDLGNTQPGDGMRYKGRGPIQITGRANYRRFGRKIGIDLEANPTIAAVPSVGLHLALEYWADRSLNNWADADDVVEITERINGGHNGLPDRKAHLAKVKAWLS